MEAAGVALAVTSLVLELYKTCEKCSTAFHNLDRDLKSFYQALVLTEHYLPHLNDIRIACQELAADIEKLLSKYTSRNRFRRMKVALEDIQPLRTRLVVQMSALQICVSMLKERGLDPGVAGSSSSTFGVSSSTLSSLDSTGSLVRTPSTQSFSNSSSSTMSTPREASSLLSCFESPLSQDKTSMVEAAMDDQTATVCNLLIAASRTPEELPVHTEQVKMLLRQGASFECTDSEDLRTPLICAIVAGGKDLVELFLEEQALVETRDGIWDWTPVIWAVMEDREDILNMLIEKGADLTAPDSIYNRTALLWAASIGNHRAAKLLLDKNEELINVTDNEGMTPLALAYFGHHSDTIRLLVKARCNPSFKLQFEFSLAWAILARDEDFARLLLEHHTDAQSTDMDGLPVLILAIQQNLPEIAKLLVNKGADVQCTDKNDVPALTFAVKDRREDIAEMLIRNGAEVDAKDGDGNTALLWAIWGNDERLVKMLVESNANVAAVDGQGDTVQKSAAWIGNEEIVQLVSSRV